jgi:hypothetical protein
MLSEESPLLAAFAGQQVSDSEFLLSDSSCILPSDFDDYVSLLLLLLLAHQESSAAWLISAGV